MSALASALQVLHPLVQAAADSAGPRIVVEHSWLDTMASVAQSLVSVLVLAMLVMGVLLLYALRRSIDELTRLVRTAYEPLRAAIADARDATGEVRALVRAMHGPVRAAGATVEEVAARVRDAVEVAHDRLARLDALVDVVQDEAEAVVVSAASLVHGVRAGSRVVGRSLGLAQRGRRRPVRVRRGDGVEAFDEEVEPDDEDVVLVHGDAAEAADSSDGVPGRRADRGAADPAAHDRSESEAPRIRRRAASRR